MKDKYGRAKQTTIKLDKAVRRGYLVRNGGHYEYSKRFKEIIGRDPYGAIRNDNRERPDGDTELSEDT